MPKFESPILSKNDFKKPFEKESTMSTPSGLQTCLSNDLIQQDSQIGGCSLKRQRKKSQKMIEAEDSQYLLDSSKLFEKPKSRKLSNQESPSPDSKRRRLSSNVSQRDYTRRMEQFVIPDHIKKVNINPELLTSNKQIEMPQITHHKSWINEFPDESPFVNEEIKEQEIENFDF